MKLHNVMFMNDPFWFVSQTPVNTFNLEPPFHGAKGPSAQSKFQGMNMAAHMGAIGEGYFDLEPRVALNTQHVAMKPVFPGTQWSHPSNATGYEPPIPAYYLPYLFAGVQGDDLNQIPHVDLPRRNPKFDFMFTGSMNGCSLVVTVPEENPTVYRVYHDSCGLRHVPGELNNPYESLDVLLRLDYHPTHRGAHSYARPTPDRGDKRFDVASNSFNFLYYVNSDWYFVCQAQEVISMQEMAIRIAPWQPPFQVKLPDIKAKDDWEVGLKDRTQGRSQPRRAFEAPN